jgi:hypothetical protein
MKTKSGCLKQKQALMTELQRLRDVLFGSLIERKVKCGKAGCRCMREADYMHGPLYYLSDKRENRTRWVYVPLGKVEETRHRLRQGQRAQDVLKRLGELGRVELALGRKGRDRK